MIAEGKITVFLGADVRIESNRVSSVSSLLKGRKNSEALALFPMIYALCAHAHSAAARLALGFEKVDLRMVLAENAREHLLRILIGWKAGPAPILPAPPIMALVTDMAQEIEHAGESRVAADLESLLTKHVFGYSPAEFLRMDSLTWMADTQTGVAKYLRELVQREWQSLGLVPPVILPDMPRAGLSEQMQRPGYCDLPTWQGRCYETGPFARQIMHPCVATIVQTFGAGLLARLMARLVDLAQIPHQIRTAKPLEMAAGLGVVETARGRLVHFAKQQDGVITDYRILAPTEWNFHPKGVAVQALAGLSGEKAQAVVNAIDPCVDFELKAA